MDFADQIRELSERAARQKDHVTTEEATKTALVMPFIAALGYNVFDPREVIPEFTAEFGIKKGEKVDYAVMRDGQPAIFFEVKWRGADLNNVHASQLYRYFSAVEGVHFAVLTNGLEYRFFSDLDSPNRMDDRPFLVFDLLDFQERHVVELKKFAKPNFDINEIQTTASELKYTAAIGKLISEEFENPSDDFVRFFATQVYSGRMTVAAREQFTAITRRALQRFMNDKINERLTTALKETSREEPTETEEVTAEEAEVESPQKREIVTTEDEIEGYFAIKSLLRDSIDVSRLHMRDTKSYCGILLDDNNRKPVCRLHFNREQKYLGIFGEDKQEVRVPINSIDDIYKYADQVIATAARYDAE